MFEYNTVEEAVKDLQDLTKSIEAIKEAIEEAENEEAG